MSDFLKNISLPIEVWLDNCQGGETIKIIKTNGITLLQRQSDLQVYIVTEPGGESEGD